MTFWPTLEPTPVLPAPTASRQVATPDLPAALHDHEVFATRSPHEAGALLEPLFGRCSLQPATPARGGFDATLHAVRVRDVTLAHLRVRSPSVLDIADSGSGYCVHMPTAGASSARVDGTELAITPVRSLVTNPGQSLLLRLDAGTPHLIVHVELGALDRVLCRLRGRLSRAAVRFDPLMDLSHDAAVRWHQAVQLISAEIMAPASLVHHDAGTRLVEDFVISTLLLVQPSNHHAQLVQGQEGTGRRAVHRSVAFIERHLADPIGLDDIARHAGLSRRSVQQGFRDDLGTTPMAYLRDLRLERVRARLVHAVPSDGTTVTRAAEQWGFTHLGNFAAVNRRRFGEYPSQPLRG